MLQADLLENISETKYLSADNYTVYRTIMRIFYLEHQKMHYQMDRDAVLVLLREQALFTQYTPDQLMLNLQQLVEWKNLTPIQDPRKPRTIAEFKNRQFQYMMSQTANDHHAGKSIHTDRRPFRHPIPPHTGRPVQSGTAGQFVPSRDQCLVAGSTGRFSASEPKLPGFPSGVLWAWNGTADEISGFYCL